MITQRDLQHGCELSAKNGVNERRFERLHSMTRESQRPLTRLLAYGRSSGGLRWVSFAPKIRL